MDERYHDEAAAKEEWDWWHAGRRRVLRAVLAEALRREGRGDERLDVLDVGCGTGGTTLGVAGGHRSFGCDLAEQALRHAGDRGLRRRLRARADALPLREAAFDVVLVLDVLEHHADDLQVAREAARVLRPGGLLLVTVPAFRALWGPHDVLSHHLRRYRRRQLLDVLGESGLEVLHHTYFNAGVFPGVLALQSLRRLLRAGAPPRPASDLPQRMPRAVNAALRELFAAERWWVPRRRLPAGVSLLAIARLPNRAAATRIDDGEPRSRRSVPASGGSGED